MSGDLGFNDDVVLEAARSLIETSAETDNAVSSLEVGDAGTDLSNRTSYVAASNVGILEKVEESLTQELDVPVHGVDGGGGYLHDDLAITSSRVRGGAHHHGVLPGLSDKRGVV